MSKKLHSKIIGAPKLPHGFRPAVWAEKAKLKSISGDPTIASQDAYWIEELQAWIAETRHERLIIRDAMGADAKIILGRDLR